MEPLVSILIPAYNTDAFVADAIRSALAQTWRRTEIIVVDDGSTDRTAEVCNRFASPAVRVVSQTHQGASAARNTALSLARGDYIQWLDADDLLAPDKLARQIESMGNSPDRRLLLSGAWAFFRHRSHGAVFVPTGLWADLSATEWLFRKLDHGVFMGIATWLVSRELTEAAGPWDTCLLADNDGEYFSRVLLASAGVRFVADARVFARRRVGSLSQIGLSKPKMEAKLLSLEKQIGYLRSLEDSNRTRAAALKALQRFFVYIYPEQPALVERARQIAATLGDRLADPQLSWKYDWIRRLFGWTPAKRAQVTYNRFKMRLLLLWDKSLARLEATTWRQ
jgi:glycosyltransferase involved in cell wall biosynthesis